MNKRRKRNSLRRCFFKLNRIVDDYVIRIFDDLIEEIESSESFELLLFVKNENVES